MRRLGVSVYPDGTNGNEVIGYLRRAAGFGYTRLFCSLLPGKMGRSEVVDAFAPIMSEAHRLGFEVTADCSPAAFDRLGVSYGNLGLFKEIGVDGLRLDVGFTGSEEALMTFNPEGLLIELNMSNCTHYVDTIMDYAPDCDRLVGCHNFYPHRYTGLSVDHFTKCNSRFKRYGLRTAAFVCSQERETRSSEKLEDGLPTLEIHRHMPLCVQVKHLVALGGTDDVIISNCYPSDDELREVSELPRNLVSFDVELVECVPDVERSIVLDELHFNRGDVSDFLLRSTQSRVKYKGHQFDVFNAPQVIRRGDVVIESSECGHYAGELQVALRDMRNGGKSNVVGRVPTVEHFLLDAIRPWQKFRFNERRLRS